MPKEPKDIFCFFEQHSQRIVKHFYCPNKKCQVYIGSGKVNAEQTCGICRCLLKEEAMFLEIPIEEQLRPVLSGRKFTDPLLNAVYTTVCFQYYCQNVD